MNLGGLLVRRFACAGAGRHVFLTRYRLGLIDHNWIALSILSQCTREVRVDSLE
jgi:hypothetical protein